MSTHNAAILQRARAAIKAGRKQEARSLLQQAVRQDRADYQAWAWLASVTPSTSASLNYARRAETLQPDDPLVRNVLSWAERRAQTATEAAGQRPGKHQVTSQGKWRSRLHKVGLALMTLLLLMSAAVFAWDQLNAKASDQAGQELATAELAAAELIDEKVLTPPTADNTLILMQPTATPTVTQPVVPAKKVANARTQSEFVASRATWTATPVATPTPTATPTYAPTFISQRASKPVSRPPGVGPAERWIDVDLETQTLNAFEGDSLVFSSLISSGTWQHPTVTGQFRIWLRYASQTMDGRRLGYDYYLENVPYVMYFYQDYALHGTYWHSNFGTPMSHGCVNMETADAEWIFHWSTIGTVVNVHY